MTKKKYVGSQTDKGAVLAYSTDPTAASTLKEKPAVEAAKKAKKSCKMRLESKGRGGKQVTVLFELTFSEAECTSLLKTLQSQLGTGGTYKDGTIEIRGDVRDRVAAYFAKMEWNLKRAGG